MAWQRGAKVGGKRGLPVGVLGPHYLFQRAPRATHAFPWPAQARSSPYSLLSPQLLRSVA